MKNSIAKNYIFNLIYQMLTVITPLVTTPYVSRVLGATNIGIYGYTFSIVTYFVLFGSLGISMYGQREIAYAQNDAQKRSKIFWELIIIRLLTNAIALAIFYFFFCRNGDYAIYYKILIFELSASAFDISWYFMGIEDFGKPVIRNIIVKAIGLVCIFLFVKEKNDLWKYLLIYSLSDFLGNVTLWFYVPKYISKPVLNKLSYIYHIQPILSLFVPQIATQVYTVLDKTMVGNITNDMSEVGYYDNAQKIVKALLALVTAMGSVMSSRIAASFSNGSKEEMKTYLSKSIHLVWMISVPFVFGLIAISEILVPWYFGNGYEPVKYLMCTTTPILIAIGLSNITGIQYLIQVGEQSKYTISVVAGALINMVFNFIFIHLFGTIGAVISTVIAEYSILGIQLYFVRKDLDIKDFFKPSIKYLISGLAMCLVVYGVEHLIGGGTIGILVSILVGVVSYIGMLIILRDQFFKDVCKQILKR